MYAYIWLENELFQEKKDLFVDLLRCSYHFTRG